MLKRIGAGILGVTALVSMGMRPAHAQVNVLGNPGFESGTLGPWFIGNNFGGTLWAVDSTNPDTGTFHARANGNNEIRQNFAPVATSLIVEVSFRLSQPGSAANAYTLYYSDASSEELAVSSSAGYNTFDVTAELDAGKSLTGFSIYGNSGAGPTDLDTVRIMANIRGGGAAPEPSSLLLWGLVPGAVLLARRRKR